MRAIVAKETMSSLSTKYLTIGKLWLALSLASESVFKFISPKNAVAKPLTKLIGKGYMTSLDYMGPSHKTSK